MSEKGFTLIEMIVSLLIVAIMASVAGMGIVTGVRGYQFAKDNSAISEKAQIAMARLSRTFLEVLDITTVGSSPARVTYNRLSGGVSIQETLYLDTADSTMKIASGGNATGGDTLIDNVNNLTLTFQKGSTPWVQGADDFSLLSTIGINLLISRPGGGNTVQFSTVVSPRNNGNRGGSTSTTVPNPQVGCFVATAAFGQENHPAVGLLKKFRDDCLLTWTGGREIVRLYYSWGPYMADAIRDRTWACILAQAFLLPFIGMAFFVMYMPFVIPLLIIASFISATLLLKKLRRKQNMKYFGRLDQRGSALIGLIATVVVFSLLGAAMLSLTSSSTFGQISASSSTRAYYLAEAGMRYAASEFRSVSGEDAKDDKLITLHNQDFTMGNDGIFHLDVYPYYFKTTADPIGTVTLQAKFPGGVPSDMAIPASGYLKVRSETAPRQFTSRTLSGANITFTMAGNLPSYTVNSNILPVGQAVVQGSLSKGGNLTLSSGAGFFPLVNGTFTIGTAASTKGATNDVYVYKRRNGNILEGIALSTIPSQSFTVSVPANAYITSMKFLNVRSTGTFSPGGPLETSRTVSYSIPIGWVTVAGSTEKVKFTDTFEDLTHWFTGGGELGGHAIATVDGNKALDVTSTYSPPWDIFNIYERQSIITLNWGSTGADMNQSWTISDHLLSYDTQIKIRVHNQDYYMAGIIFRVDSSGQMYGVSFLRANTGSGFLGIGDKDRVPDELCPLNTTPMIVLWQQTPASTLRWLAYKTLTTADGVIDANGRYLLDWSTLLVRVIEADSLSFDQGGPNPVLYGDTITGSMSGATATVNGTPILNSGSWSGSNAAGWLTVSNVTKVGGAVQFQNGENLLVNGVVRARYTGNSRQKDNYIRVYFGNTSNRGTPNSNPLDSNNRRGNTRIADPTLQILNWPVDNISEWASLNDYYTLVQWNDNLNLEAGDVRLGTGSEAKAIIRTNTLVTPSSGNFTQTEIGLDTWGSSSTSVYFDDFGLQTPAPGQTQGFLPAIQQ